MIKNILVCFLFTKYDSEKELINFIKYYKKYKSGAAHKLIICFKLINNKKIIHLRKYLKNIKYIEFIDPFNVNDYDFGSYKRVSRSFSSYKILFLNSHSYPITKNWLKKLVTHYKNKTILATSASNESFFTSLRLKKSYKIISYLKRYNKYKKLFKAFPNPHIRTSSFLIKGSDFLSFVKDKVFFEKEDTWNAESGFLGLTNFFFKKKFKIFVINSDGKKFNKNHWKISETYYYSKQSKSIISDKHTRKYLKLSFKKRLISSTKVWGNY